MRTVARHCVRTLTVVLAAAAALGAWVYVSNARTLARTYALEPVPIAAAADAGAALRGKMLADVTGCTDCHREDLRGGLFDDEGWLHGHYYTANLTLRAQRYSDEDLARVIRLGVRPDGRGVVAMPSFGFVRLTDSEVADLIAFIRSIPAGGPEQPEHFVGPLDNWDLWRGKLKPAIAYVAGERRKEPVDAGPRHASARHLVAVVCVECHGGDLKGNGWDSGAPDLAVIKAYSLEDFRRLLRTGVAVGDRQLGLMSAVAKSRLHNLSDEQIAGIRDYLVARAELPAH